jgi:hypothetical protein
MAAHEEEIPLEIEGVVVGNAPAEGAGRRGWFIGQFMPDATHGRTDFELKWGVHPRGEREQHGWVSNETCTTFSILLEGSFRIDLRQGERVDRVVLERRGDYVICAPGIEHRWEAPEDCIVLTVRLPSVADDQIVRPR